MWCKWSHLLKSNLEHVLLRISAERERQRAASAELIQSMRKTEKIQPTLTPQNGRMENMQGPKLSILFRTQIWSHKHITWGVKGASSWKCQIAMPNGPCTQHHLNKDLLAASAAAAHRKQSWRRLENGGGQDAAEKNTQRGHKGWKKKVHLLTLAMCFFKRTKFNGWMMAKSACTGRCKGRVFLEALATGVGATFGASKMHGMFMKPWNLQHFLAQTASPNSLRWNSVAMIVTNKMSIFCFEVLDSWWAVAKTEPKIIAFWLEEPELKKCTKLFQNITLFYVLSSQNTANTRVIDWIAWEPEVKKAKKTPVVVLHFGPFVEKTSKKTVFSK